MGQSEAAAGAVAHLALVNEHGRVFARAEVPLALLTVDRRQNIEVFIPNALVEEAEALHASVEIRQTLPNPTFFDHIRSQELAANGRRFVHVSASNGVNNSLRRAVFLLQAVDKEERVVGRWRVDWHAAVEPLDRLEFDAVLSDAGPLAAAVSRWDVIGAGEQMP